MKLRETITNNFGIKVLYNLKEFIKPKKKNLHFSLYPVTIDFALHYMTKTGPDDQEILNNHYNYWSVKKGYHNFWFQAGIKFVY